MSLLKKYYVLFSVLFIVSLVILIAAYKTFFQESTYIYTKVKVGQGLWWAVTARPSIWYINAINKGDSAYDVLGRSEAEILDKKVYLWSINDQYDVYITVKLKVSGNKKTQSYSFNHQPLSVSSPIEIQFPQENIRGTIIALSETKFPENLIEKTIYLEKPNANLWEYEAIKPGSTISDGEHTILKILDKSIKETTQLTSTPNGTVTLTNTGNQAVVTIKAKILVKKVHGVFILGEEKVIEPGRELNLSLANFVLEDFRVSKIE